MPLRATAFAGLCLGLKLFGLRVAETGCFGLLLGGGRCLSPREASLHAVSLLLPAADTFDAATFVLAGEVFLVVFLGAVEMGLVEAVAEVPAHWLAAQHLWLLAQAAQVAASALFLRGQLGATAGAVGATALAHARLGSRLVALEPLPQMLLGGPVWLHAGWAWPLSLIHLHMAFSVEPTAETAALLAAAFAAIAACCAACA